MGKLQIIVMMLIEVSQEQLVATLEIMVVVPMEVVEIMA